MADLNDQRLKVWHHARKYAGVTEADRLLSLIGVANEEQLRRALESWVGPTIEEALKYEKGRISDKTRAPDESGN